MDLQKVEQARYIFSIAKMLRRHLFSGLTRLEIESRDCASPELSVAQLNLLMAVRAEGEVTLSGLAEILGVSSPSASVMVKRLVERGLLIRERSDADRRKVVIGVSPNENERFDRIEEQMLAAFVELIEDVGPETAQKWGEVLQRVEQVLQQRRETQNSPMTGGKEK